jgi:hypothetical protein
VENGRDGEMESKKRLRDEYQETRDKKSGRGARDEGRRELENWRIGEGEKRRK